MSVIYTNIMAEIENRRFLVKTSDRYDPTGMRDSQFLRRGVEPLFRPDETSQTTANLNVHHLVDMINKNISFVFLNPPDLNEVVRLLNEYLKYVNKFNSGHLKMSTDAKLIIKKAQDAHTALSKLQENHNYKLRRNDPNYKQSIFDIFLDIGGE